MNGVADFFKRLFGVHLFFWELSFRSFDVLSLFGGIVVAVGMTDYLANTKFDGTTLSVALQFIVYMLAFLFCYAWSEFRSRLADIAGNMICLSLCISVLAALIAFLLKFMISVPPLAENIGAVFHRMINTFRFLLPNLESRYPLAALLFAVSYFFVLLNTIYSVGGQEFRRAWASAKLVPLMVSFCISLIACFLVLWPILATFE